MKTKRECDMMESMKIHCIGIGGIGLSALARYYKAQGHEVSGSDASSSELVETLRKEGISVAFGHAAENVADDVDLVVYTIAAQDSNVELVQARSRGVVTKTYPEALGDITQDKTTITVSGTHGKTTTTAMMYYAMKACGINPTVIVGSLLSDHGVNEAGSSASSSYHPKDGLRTNFVSGDSEYMIVEACEYKRSFLNLHPTHAVITNIDEDHLDYYKDLDDIKSAFQSFADRIPVEGTLTTHRDVRLMSLARHIDADVIDASTIELSVLGEHNRYNAQLVLALLTSLHFDEVKVRAGLKQFMGTWRRMEYKGKTLHGVPVYDDYGHHPKEIAASVEALREKYPVGEYKLVMLFQPHLYSRTKALLPDFVNVLKDVDEVHLLPIYRARLEDTSIINEDIVITAINQVGGNAKRLESLADIPACVESITDPKSVIVNMGAGNAFEELQKVTLL
jgi:UDP-N-acetylmuramate--alanine ligase